MYVHVQCTCIVHVHVQCTGTFFFLLEIIIVMFRYRQTWISLGESELQYMYTWLDYLLYSQFITDCCTVEFVLLTTR